MGLNIQSSPCVVSLFSNGVKLSETKEMRKVVTLSNAIFLFNRCHIACSSFSICSFEKVFAPIKKPIKSGENWHFQTQKMLVNASNHFETFGESNVDLLLSVLIKTLIKY